MLILGPDNRPLTLSQVAELKVNEQETKMTTASDTELDQAPEVLVTRLKLEAYRGLDMVELDLTEHPRGVVFAGTKGIGKTCHIRGIETVLWNAGVEKRMIKTGADKTRLSLDFVRNGQAMSVVRTIPRSKSPEVQLLPPDGIPLPRAVEQMRAMFGQGIAKSGRDPLRLYTAETEELRKLLLQAVPCTVTAEQLTRWCEEEKPWNVDGHGQEVLGRVKDSYFERRTKAGQECDQAEADAKKSEADAAGLRVPGLPAMTEAAAQTHVSTAESRLAVLRERRRQSAELEASAETTRAKIASMRAEAEERMGQAELQPPAPEELAAAKDEEASAIAAVDAAKKALALAEKRWTDAMGARSTLEKKANKARLLQAELDSLVNQANDLEATLATRPDCDPQSLAEQIAAAEGDLETARDLVAKACQADRLRAAEAKAAEARATYEAKKTVWEKLERIVKRLNTEAPAELAKQGNPIPGLEITAKAILWNGHDLDLSSDGEKLEFAVDVVKRTATGAKIMVVDKMESLPPSLRPGFVRKALEGGWVLFATLVQDGPMEIVDCYRLAKQAA
jgi:hypothetical protein